MGVTLTLRWSCRAGKIHRTGRTAVTSFDEQNYTEIWGGLKNRQLSDCSASSKFAKHIIDAQIVRQCVLKQPPYYDIPFDLVLQGTKQGEIFIHYFIHPQALFCPFCLVARKIKVTPIFMEL